MAKPVKRKIDGGEQSTASTGRTTPKGTKPGTKADSDGTIASSRYTPPTPSASKYDTPSPTWVPVLMFGLFGIGLLTIFLNYTEVLPGGSNGWYMLGGLAAILGGIITSTQLR